MELHEAEANYGQSRVQRGDTMAAAVDENQHIKQTDNQTVESYCGQNCLLSYLYRD